jgi:hypothetical protein
MKKWEQFSDDHSCDYAPYYSQVGIIIWIYLLISLKIVVDDGESLAIRDCIMHTFAFGPLTLRMHERLLINACVVENYWWGAGDCAEEFLRSPRQFRELFEALADSILHGGLVAH